MSVLRATLAAAAVLWTGPAIAAGIESEDAERVLPARDSLAIGAEPDAGARLMLERLRWEPGTFRVRVGDGLGRGEVRGEVRGETRPVVRFPSPRPRGDERNDTVVMEWFRAAGDGDGKRRPAVLVLHILGGNMELARAIATYLARSGIHAFAMQMPDYGERGDRARRRDVSQFVPRVRQAVADARRARDAIAVLPGVIPDRIGIQGTSLGGFVAATTAALDRGFDPVFLMLAGGDLPSMVASGEKDTAKIRQAFAREGITGKRLDELLRSVDPAVIAHRLDPERTWLYSAALDRVVPRANALALGRAARLDKEHHLWLLGNHYTCLPFLPGVLDQVRGIVQAPRIPPAPRGNRGAVGLR